MATTTGSSGMAAWRTRDVVVTAALAVVFGILYQVWALVWGALNPVLGTVAGDFLNGFWYIAALLIPYIIRRPGAALVGQTVAALVEMVAGSLWGIDVIVSGLVMGLGAELIFALTGWKRYDLPVLLAAGALAASLEFVHAFIVYGYAPLETLVVAGKYVANLISALILGSLLAKWVGDALARTGVLSGFALGKGQVEEV